MSFLITSLKGHLNVPIKDMSFIGTFKFYKQKTAIYHLLTQYDILIK